MAYWDNNLCEYVECPCPPSPPRCCPPISKLANFANGNGCLTNRNNNAARRPPVARPPLNCCPGPRRNQQQYVPPVLIQPGQSINDTPAQRLRCVDVLEELNYFTQKEQNVNYCCCYDQCGVQVCYPQPQCQKEPPEPVQYSRRQRFSFGDGRRRAVDDVEPQSPWDCDNDNNGGGGNGVNCCGGGGGGNNGYRQNCGGGGGGGFRRRRGPPYPGTSFDEIPVGKNPVPKQDGHYQGDDDKANDRRRECERKLPKESGVYYFDKRRGEFIPHIQEVNIIQAPPPQPPAPEVLVEEEAEPDIIIQPIVQQMMMPGYGYGNCCMPPSCCNPFMTGPGGGMGMGMMGGGVFGGMGGMGGMGMGGMGGLNNGCCGPGIVPMCIPTCNQYGMNCSSTQQSAPAPNYIPIPMPVPGPPRKKHKKKKHKKKRRETSEEEEEEEDYGDYDESIERENSLPPVLVTTTEEPDATVTTILIPPGAGDVDVQADDDFPGDGDGDDE